MIKYKQIKDVHWLNTPVGTIWIKIDEEYIQPENESFRDTPLGVSLYLLDDEDIQIFEQIIINKK